MEDFELTLFDRLNIIKDTIAKYGDDKFYLSFSGGKDSTILHRMLDMAVPNNRIPRVFIDTGIEYSAIRTFVGSLASEDDRFVIVKPNKPIKAVLERYGYPFKSKEHSCKIGCAQKGTQSKSILHYLASDDGYGCPKKLLYQARKDCGLRISDKCCYELKKHPAHDYEKRSGRTIAILGLRIQEGGQRKSHKGCVVFDAKGRMRRFKPLNVVSDEFEKWFVKEYEVKLCELYYPPYGFERVGCKGCPYAINLQEELEVMARLMPNERKQCELIWKPVYDEYRRLGYRLTKNEQIKLF